MATVDLLLSSSPPRFGGCQVAAMSSSPVFPSPGALVRRLSHMRPRNLTAPVPMFSTTSFTTTAQLSENQIPAKPTADPEDPFPDKPAKPAKPKSSRKPKAVEKAIDGDEPTVKKPRKPRAKKVDVETGAPAAAVEKPPRKPRAKKVPTETQSKLPKGRVTKATTGSRAEKALQRKKTATVSNHFGSTAARSTDPFDTPRASKNDLLLQEAVKRRISWTPPKPNVESPDITITTAESDGGVASLSNISENEQTISTNLFGHFVYANGGNEITPEQTVDQTGTKKRKLIELVSKNNTTVEIPVTKVKAVKKKARTITELAIAPYVVDVNEDNPGLLPTPLLQHPSSEGTASAKKVPGIMDGFKVPPKPRLKSPVKASSKKPKAKKGTAQSPILLSPQTALKRVEKQEFVFGTSSQLARGDSPALLRDLQEAMRVSNQVEDDPFANVVGELSPSKSASASERGTESYIANRNLWAAASRSVEGVLPDIETVDISESPQDQPSLKPYPLGSNDLGVQEDSMKAVADDGWHDLDAFESPLKKKNPVDEPPSSKVIPTEAATALGLISNLPKGNRTRKPSSPNAKATNLKSSGNDDVFSGQSSAPQKPDYGSYPTAKLAKEIASYHFKTIKGRDQMISLLEKCWEEKQITKVNTAKKAQEAEIPKPDDNKSLVLRQTPRKIKMKASLIPEEIYDSESSLTPSPPRRRTKVRTPPRPLQLSVSSGEADESLILSPTSQQLRLHQHITRAVTTAPPSKDPKNPSWHEKILLYDPIILEDLTVWLNTSALQKVGWDGEVCPKEVKKWCLEHSICCLWRENLRGMTRSRY